jgi:putative nucleotidyltransferase with HDIG domain
MYATLYDIFNRLDSTTYNHSVRVMSIAKEIEEYYDFLDNKLSSAALIHDIGKIYVSSKILDKKGKLTSLEKDIVNLHPYIGYQILKSFDVDEDICRLVLYHHGAEPICMRKLADYDNPYIMDQAVLLHSIDSYEALTSDRSYHRGYLANEALDIMLNETGHHPLFLEYLFTVTQQPSFECDSKVFRNCGNAEPSFMELVMNNPTLNKKRLVTT